MTNMFHHIVDEARDRERRRIIEALEEIAHVAADDQSRFVWLDEAIKIVRGETL